MTQQSEEHLQRIKDLFCERADGKYRRGNEEYGSVELEDMSTLNLLDNALDEAVDQVVYLLTLWERHIREHPKGV